VFLGWQLLGEPMTQARATGVGLITLGCLVVATR
jgi:uncharacterized membrane protein